MKAIEENIGNKNVKRARWVMTGIGMKKGIG